jgi:hypothetical protein
MEDGVKGVECLDGVRTVTGSFCLLGGVASVSSTRFATVLRFLFVVSALDVAKGDLALAFTVATNATVGGGGGVAAIGALRRLACLVRADKGGLVSIVLLDGEERDGVRQNGRFSLTMQSPILAILTVKTTRNVFHVDLPVLAEWRRLVGWVPTPMVPTFLDGTVCACESDPIADFFGLWGHTSLRATV